MPAFGLALAASVAVRAASLNLCTDEYLLLLAEPRQIATVSYLSRLPDESVLWRDARRHPANQGTLESVIVHRPTLVLTMGGGGRAGGVIAARLGIRVLDLPYPQSIDDVVRQARTVAAALGTSNRAEELVRELRRLRTAPAGMEDAAFVGGGGLSLSPGSLGAEWLRLAGYRQRALPNGRLSYEELATDPPEWLIRSDYRQRQASRNVRWFDHPLVRRLQSRTLVTDGRPWTCAGLPMIAEVRRLREMRR